jgi:hypothetical protein
MADLILLKKAHFLKTCIDCLAQAPWLLGFQWMSLVARETVYECHWDQNLAMVVLAGN